MSNETECAHTRTFVDNGEEWCSDCPASMAHVEAHRYRLEREREGMGVRESQLWASTSAVPLSDRALPLSDTDLDRRRAPPMEWTMPALRAGSVGVAFHRAIAEVARRETLRIGMIENYLAGQALLSWFGGPWVMLHRRRPPQPLDGPFLWPEPARPMLPWQVTPPEAGTSVPSVTDASR